jgi:hypothetical protein
VIWQQPPLLLLLLLRKKRHQQQYQHFQQLQLVMPDGFATAARFLQAAQQQLPSLQTTDAASHLQDMEEIQQQHMATDPKLATAAACCGAAGMQQQ